MREFDGFSGAAALTGQGWPRAGVRAEGEGVIGGGDAPIAQAEAAGEIEAPGQGAKVASGESLKPWYLPRARRKINCFWGTETAPGMGRPRLPCCTQAMESGC